MAVRDIFGMILGLKSSEKEGNLKVLEAVNANYQAWLA